MRKIERELIGIKAYVDKGMEDWDSIARRPYFRLRGRPVTEEQAMEIIRKTDSLFRNTPGIVYLNEYDCFGFFEDLEDYSEYLDEYVSSLELEKKFIGNCNFHNAWFSDMFGWAHPDGTIGLNYLTSKYPDIDELIDECGKYARFFPYLDMVIGITYWNEICEKRWEAERRGVRDVSLEDMERAGFEDAIEAGVWVHDGVVEIMTPERTLEMYLKYERLYEVDEPQKYMCSYYARKKLRAVDEHYLYRCLEAYGIEDPRGFAEEKISKYVLKKLRAKGET